MDAQSPLEAVFFAALDRVTAAERAAYLDEATRGDPDLRRRVEKMLAAHGQAGSFLERPAGGRGVTVDEPAGEGPGTTIGPYKLLQLIGEGGMGTVFMAEQAEPVRRTVALKLIKPGMDSRQVIARFEAERQALALMDHPNIARVLDAGTTAGGRPYFVMELVKGVPVTRYCDEHRLTPRQRLELFVPVCQAIQHAHQKGVIHRDVKPSNVLVCLYDGKPVPKVIDFGVAKATGSKLTERTLFTEFGAIVGTVEYMSPEQAQLDQLDVDTRSDIYSLGVLLYELLTGTTPLERKRMKRVAILELLRLVREEEAPRPSTRLSTADGLPSIAANRGTEPKKLSGLMRGELDWIVLKALEKDRNRRYETPNGLAHDVERYLNDEAVGACPPSAGYRFRKFVRRNKGPVSAASLLFLALTGGVVGTTWGLVRADQQRRIAEDNVQKAVAAGEAETRAKETALAPEAETRAVLDFVESKVFAAARPKDQGGGMGREVKMAEAVKGALPFVRNRFHDQPLIEARLRKTLGISFAYLGDARLAAEQFDAARTIYRKLRGPDHADTLASMNNLANSYAALGRHADALALREETLALRKATLGPGHLDTLASMNNLAASYDSFGRYADALKLNEETLALMKATLGPDHPYTLVSMNNVAASYSSLGRHADALKLREKTLGLRKATLGPDHPDTLSSMNNLAISYAALGRQADALKLREETLALQKARLGPDHDDTLAGMHSLAVSYRSLGRHADALKLREETLALRKARLGPDHPDTLLSMSGVAESLVDLGRGAEAVPVIDECVRRAAGQVVHPRLLPPLIMDLRLRHFEKTKDAAGCRQTAVMWENLNRGDAASLYNAACMRAVTAAMVRANDQSKKVATEAAADADRAMAWLTQAVAAGLKDATLIKKDTDLDALRDRPDFKKLLAGLEAGQALEGK